MNYLQISCLFDFISSIYFCHKQHYYTVSQKKQDTKLLPITFPNVNRFSKFFHWQTHW